MNYEIKLKNQQLGAHNFMKLLFRKAIYFVKLELSFKFVKIISIILVKLAAQLIKYKCLVGLYSCKTFSWYIFMHKEVTL